MTTVATPVAFAIRDSARAPTVSPLLVHTLSVAQRARRAGLRLGITWGIGLACIAVPLLHFVLVPLGLLAGPVVAFLAWRQQVELSGDGPCPRCAEKVAVEPGTIGWPAVVTCLSCKTVLFLSPPVG